MFLAPLGTPLFYTICHCAREFIWQSNMKSDINNLLSRVFYAFHFIVLKNCQKISVLLDGENIYLNFHDILHFFVCQNCPNEQLTFAKTCPILETK